MKFININKMKLIVNGSWILTSSLILFLFLLNCNSNNEKKGLIGYWKFDQCKDTIVTDVSGNGHHGIIQGAEWTIGKVNQALSFTEGDYVEIPDHKDLRIKFDITIMAWIKKTHVSREGKSMGIVSKSSNGKWDYDLFMSTSKLEHPAFYSDGFKAEGGDIEVISSVSIRLNEWHHVAISREKSNGKIYIDGVLTGTATLPEPFPMTNRSLRIGNDHDGSFFGIIDEVRIYNRALSQREIQAVIAVTREKDISFEHIVIDTSYGGIRAVGDINGDGFVDIIHSYWYQSAPLAWYEFKKSTEWKRHIIRENFYPCTDDFELADIDGDQDADIIIVRADGKRSNDVNADNVQVDEVKIIWLENPGPKVEPGAFPWQEHLIGIHQDPRDNYNKDIEVADFTGDGKLDVVTRTHESVSVFRQDSPNQWTKILHTSIHPHEGMAIGDLDTDGDPDIVLNGFWLETPDNPDKDNWIEHNIDSSWWTQTGDWTANNCKVYVNDINGDGRLDVLLSHSEREGYPVAWYETTEPKTGLWKEHVIAYIDFCHTLQAADIDFDGDIDVIVGEMEKSNDPDQILLFKNKGNGLAWDKQVIADLSIYSGKLADIGNDGDLDLVANRNWNQAPLEIWENELKP